MIKRLNTNKYEEATHNPLGYLKLKNGEVLSLNI